MAEGVHEKIGGFTMNSCPSFIFWRVEAEELLVSFSLYYHKS